MTKRYHKAGDLEPDYQFALKEGGAAKDLTAAQSVTARIEKPDGTTFERACAIDDVAGGICSFSWQAGDTDAAGVHKIEVTVTWSNGETETYPDVKWAELHIVARLPAPA